MALSLAPLAWAGIALAFVGVWLVTWRREENSGTNAWVLPLSIFVGSAICDIGINAIQVTRTTSLTAPVLPTICFAASSPILI